MIVVKTQPESRQTDPIVLALREGYVAHRDRGVQRWYTEANAARWTAERDLWLAGESMVCSTSEVFDAANIAGLDLWKSFTHAHDRDDVRRWQLPGREGGPLSEVELCDGKWIVVSLPDDPGSVRQTRSQIARTGGNARWSNARGTA